MSEERFDLSYTGLIAPGADPERARQRLSEIFKLSETGVDRLFAGTRVTVKRGVDAATAARFDEIFAHAGAILTVTPAGVPDAVPSIDPAVGADVAEPRQARAINTSHLALAPQGGTLEEPPIGGRPNLDLTYLALVPGHDWTLEDCEPPPTPIPEPDISYLSLAPVERRLETEPDPGLD